MNQEHLDQLIWEMILNKNSHNKIVSTLHVGQLRIRNVIAVFSTGQKREYSRGAPLNEAAASDETISEMITPDFNINISRNTVN
jgi:hypothetical protein